MKTYGKKKKSILSSFSVHRDANKTDQSLQDKSVKRNSTMIVMSAFYGNDDEEPIRTMPSHLDDSIEEMASMLLDDTTMNELKGEPGKRRSLFNSAKVLPQIPRPASRNEKALPQLPQLLFRGDNAWAYKGHPVMTAAVNPSYRSFGSDGDESDSFPAPLCRQPSQARKGSAPPVPRKSSRRSHLSKQNRSLERDANESTPQRRHSHTRSRPINTDPFQQEHNRPMTSESAVGINNKINAVLAASRALKPPLPDGSLIHAPLVAIKKRRVVGNKVLAKMKQAINERLHDSGLKRRTSSTRKIHLLDDDMNQLPDYDDDHNTVSTMDIRMNEGSNFTNSKVQSITGHGTIKRKPLAEDGKSLKSHQSSDDPFSDDPHSSSIARTPTSFENRLKRESSSDRTHEFVPPFPERPSFPSELLPRASRYRNGQPSIDVDFDALFSSSPLAQSTPRIRLEPTFQEDGSSHLRNVLADTRSLFDHDSSICQVDEMEVDMPPPRKTSSRRLLDAVKRRNSQLKEPATLMVRSSSTRRTKRHPSPSKAELESLEVAFKKYSHPERSRRDESDEVLTTSFGDLRTGGALAPKDGNGMIMGVSTRKISKSTGLDIFSKLPASVAGSRITESPRRHHVKPSRMSMIPNQAGSACLREGPAVSKFHDDGSSMDIDELQWNESAYRV